MTSEPWHTVGIIASTAGVTTCAIGTAKGILSTYQTYSPETSLAGSERWLEKVRSRLQGLSPKEREEIEIKTRNESFTGSSLEILEETLVDLTNMHCRLSHRIDQSTFMQRHNPYSEFRVKLRRFEAHARALLDDTMKTTVPSLDDLTLEPENSRRAMERSSSSRSTFNPEISRSDTNVSSSSKSTGRYSLARESFSDDVGFIPLSRMV